MKHYIIILDITIVKLIERIKCKSDIAVTTIIDVFRSCCNKTFEYLEKDDVKIKGKLKHNSVHIQVLMKHDVYLKRIGKYVKDQQRKILDDLSAITRSEIEKINWENILRKEN